jgi:CHRD domain
VLAGFAGISVVQAENADMTYKAELSPLNSKAIGSDARGEATFTVSGDQLTIHVSANGVSPNMEHLQHLHGFAKGGRKSKCPTARNDTNGDGIIDLIEPEPVAGTTMVSFHDDPVSMEMVKTPTRPPGQIVPIHTRRRFP